MWQRTSTGATARAQVGAVCARSSQPVSCRRTGVWRRSAMCNARWWCTSPGEPSEKGCYADIEAAYKFVVAAAGTGTNVIVYGQSGACYARIGQPGVRAIDRRPYGLNVLLVPGRCLSRQRTELLAGTAKACALAGHPQRLHVRPARHHRQPPALLLRHIPEHVQPSTCDRARLCRPRPA